MTIKHPTQEDLPQLRQLWKEAFGDSDAFLDLFFATGFHPQRCLGLWEDNRLASAIYWFHCTLNGHPVAYLYALATDRAFRGRGLAHRLMAHLHGHLTQQGYTAALLVPGTEALSGLYKEMGYAFCGGIREFSRTAAGTAVPLRSVTPEEYARLRRQYLPENSVVQEGENLRFLAAQAALYAGDGFLMAAKKENNTLFALEMLGSTAAASQIIQALNCDRGIFRTPGTQRPFAMFHPLGSNTPAPADYFAFAFD